MNIIKVGEHQSIRIINPHTTPGVVVVFPMTRVMEKNRSNWNRILQVTESSNLFALVLIDKTPLKEATSHFLNAKMSHNTQVYILQRDIKEDLYDSILSIVIEGNLWILQLHDDDHWSGVLELPIDAKQNEIFPLKFFTIIKSQKCMLNWENSPPARSNFTLVPSKIWMKFSEFATAHGSHLAASTDYTLNYIVRLTCHRQKTLDFEYVYDDRNWKNSRLQRSQLTRLSRLDGWDHLSGIDVQLLNRTLDTLSCLNFFKDFVPHKSFQIETSNLQKNLKLSLKRLMLLHARHSFLFLITPIFQSLGKVFALSDFQRQLAGQLIAIRLVLRVSKAEGMKEVVSELEKTRQLVFLPKLEQRFEFWIKNLEVKS